LGDGFRNFGEPEPARDVNERVKAEERLRFQAQLLDAVDQAIIAIDLEGRVRFWNRGAERLYGWSEQQVIGRRLREFVISEDLWESTDGIMSELRAGRIWSGEFVALRKNGTTFQAEITDTPVRDDQGNVVGIIGVSTDITERKRAEARLKESEQRYRTLVEQIPAVTYIDRADGSDEPIYTSPQIEAMLGYTTQEWIEGRLWPERLHPDDRERILAADERFEAGGAAFSEGYRLLAKGGSVGGVREGAGVGAEEAGQAP